MYRHEYEEICKRELPSNKFKCLDIHFNIYMRRYGLKETLKELLYSYIPYDLVKTLIDDITRHAGDDYELGLIKIYIFDHIRETLKYNKDIEIYSMILDVCKEQDFTRIPLYNLRRNLWYPKSQIHYLKRMYNKTKDPFYLDILAYGIQSGIYRYKLDRDIDIDKVEDEYIRRLNL